jgi:polar amino acid transport system substrate-binding protein
MAAFLQLVSERKLNLERMITHVFSLDEAPKAYELITGATGKKYLAVLLKYQPEMESPSNMSSASRVYLKKNTPALTPKERQLTVGFIGAGNFAQSYLIPVLKSLKGVQLRGVATAKGINAHSVAKKFGFSFCTADHAEILEDPDIRCIFVATRHDLHADLVVKALQHHKHVFVEKPLALSEEELTAVIAAYRTTPGELMVGFNRRFSPLIHEVKQFLGALRTPLTIHYRINAGFFPKTHWAQDPIEGGGRILGEVCHFVDLIQYLTEADPIKVYAESISSNDGSIVNTDNINITIKLQDGSIGIITYVSMGDTAVGKERIEIYGGSSTAIINDFKWVELYRDRKFRKIRDRGKGHREEIKAFVDAMTDGNPSPISFSNLVSTTMTTIKIVDSLDGGTPIRINDPSAETLEINEGRNDHSSTHGV